VSHSHVTHSTGHESAPKGAHGSFRGYMLGAVLSLLLTLASFGVVMFHFVPPGAGVAAIVVLCVAQLVVQLFYFLHIGSARSQLANTGIFACTAFLIAVIVGLSLWVMHNANVNMMPTHLSVERAMARD
jgi:cytochrome o ubiquinol oxidase subunit IV